MSFLQDAASPLQTGCHLTGSVRTRKRGDSASSAKGAWQDKPENPVPPFVHPTIEAADVRHASPPAEGARGAFQSPKWPNPRRGGPLADGTDTQPNSTGRSCARPNSECACVAGSRRTRGHGARTLEGVRRWLWAAHPPGLASLYERPASGRGDYGIFWTEHLARGSARSFPSSSQYGLADPDRSCLLNKPMGRFARAAAPGQRSRGGPARGSIAFRPAAGAQQTPGWPTAGRWANRGAPHICITLPRYRRSSSQNRHHVSWSAERIATVIAYYIHPGYGQRLHGGSEAARIRQVGLELRSYRQK